MSGDFTASSDTARRSLRLHGSIAQDIGTAILTGRYQPGDLLDNEVLSSEKLNVSRTAYREAVRILAAKGMVASRPKAGTRVTERSGWNFLDPDVLRWIFEHGPPEPRFVRELFELRRIVEPSAAALAAQRRSEEQLAVLRAALDEMAREGLATEDGRGADRRFHETILLATGNEPLGTLTSGISAAVRWTTLFKARGGRVPRDPLPDHAAVFDAIDRRDPNRARDAMEALVSMAFTDIVSVNEEIAEGDGRQSNP